MTKKDNENFESSTKCWICDNVFVEIDFKVRDHCHVPEKYRGAARRDCNISLKKCDAHLIMEELGKFDFKINVIPNGFGKYMSFSLDNKLFLIDSFQV